MYICPHLRTYVRNDICCCSIQLSVLASFVQLDSCMQTVLLTFCHAVHVPVCSDFFNCTCMHICDCMDVCVSVSYYVCLFMVALWNRETIYIFILFLLLLSSFFFPRLISAVGDWMSTILRHMVWS